MSMCDGNECVETVCHSNILVQERGRKANFKNSARHSHHKVKVDGCLIKEGLRSDWIVTKVGVGSVVVELKGKDIDHACKQVMATISHANCQPWLEEKRGILIVCSRYPSFDTSVAKAKVNARKRGIRLSVVCDKSDNEFENMLTG